MTAIDWTHLQKYVNHWVALENDETTVVDFDKSLSLLHKRVSTQKLIYCFVAEEHENAYRV